GVASLLVPPYGRCERPAAQRPTNARTLADRVGGDAVGSVNHRPRATDSQTAVVGDSAPSGHGGVCGGDGVVLRRLVLARSIAVEVAHRRVGTGSKSGEGSG